MTSLLWLWLWFVLSSHSTCFLWAFVVVFNDSFDTRDRGYITFTALLSAVYLPLIKHLAPGSASIYFATQASFPVLAAIMCHCWLHFSVTRSEHPALTWLRSWLPHVLIHRHNVHLLPEFTLMPSSPDGSCWNKLHCISVRGKWRLITITITILTTHDVEAMNMSFKLNECWLFF